MSVKLVIAVTDKEWFDNLSRQSNLAEVNFWSPSESNFSSLQQGELFFFKLHYPLNYIVGGGVFLHSTTMLAVWHGKSFKRQMELPAMKKCAHE